MKPYIIIIPLLLSALSCRTPQKVDFPDRTPEERLAEYAGDYDLTDMIWEGSPDSVFDFDNDGLIGDVFTELTSLANIKNNWANKVSNCCAMYKKRANEDGSIDIRFDAVTIVQNYNYFEDGTVVPQVGETWLFYLDYNISNAGTITVITDSYSRPYSPPSSSSVENDSIIVTPVSHEPGKIVVRITHKLYDFAQNEFVTGNILTTYSIIEQTEG